VLRAGRPLSPLSFAYRPLALRKGIMSQDRKPRVSGIYMNLEEKKEVVPPIVVEPAPAPTSEPTPPEKKEETPATPPNIDYIKELEALEGSNRAYTPPKSKEEQLRQAKFTLESTKKRIVDLGGTVDETPILNENPLDDFQNNFLEQQAEAEIRKTSTSEDEVRFKMYFYKNRIKPSGNVFRDVEEALWLANRHRTQNTLNELKNRPPPPGVGSGPGQKSPEKTIIALSPEKEAELLRFKYKKVAPDKYEGKFFIYRYDANHGWIQEKKTK